VFILKEVAVKEYDPVQNLLDTNKMGAAIMQCFIENDTEGVLEIIESYLYALNKTQFLKEAKVPRSTVYNFFKRRNPTIKTLAKIIHASAHS
jgi:DNA-binding phage protein